MHIQRILSYILVLLCPQVPICRTSAASAAGAPASQTAALNQEANAAYDAKDWGRAAKLYEELSIKQKPVPPRVWLRLGTALRGLSQYDKALSAFDKASQAGMTSFAQYGAATIYALQSKREQTLAHLEKAIDGGYNLPEQLLGQAEFASLRSDATFAKLVERTKRNERPCAYKAQNRQFDFWLGEWNAETTQGGVPSGTSKIERLLGDCVVLENWMSLGSSYSGKSYNTYNTALKRWEQYWVDNVGGAIFFYGGLKDGVMDYYTDDLPQPDGTKLRRHLQFFNLGPDKVRQYSQGSSDGGKTWKPEYDFTYVRKK